MVHTLSAFWVLFMRSLVLLRAMSPVVVAGLVMIWAALSLSAQRASSLIETEIVTATGSRGVMVRPVSSGPHPGILHLHGSGDSVAGNLEILRLFARAGYVAMDVEYRQLEPGAIDTHDIDRSLECLNGSPHVRRGVIGLNGFSLGARMALLLSAREPVRAVSAIAARTSSGSSPTVLAQASRLNSPILLQHGTQDSVVPYNDSVLLANALKSLGRRVELLSYPGADHAGLPWDDVYGKVLAFFAVHLK